MVIILIKYHYYLKKLASGNLLDDNELNYVKAYQAYAYNVYLTILLAVGIVIFLTGFIFTLLMNLIVGLILLILGLLIIIYYSPIFFFLNRKYYKKALAKYLENRLKEYQNKKILYVYFKCHSNFNIKKDSVYFIYDEYYFTIKEDLLCEEKIGNNIFKYPDNNFEKIGIKFKLNEISSFLSLKEGKYHNANYLELVEKKIVKEEFCQINLKDFRTINIGMEVGLVLNELLPYLNEAN